MESTRLVYFTILFTLTLTSTSCANAISACACHDGYVARENLSDGFRCHGILLKHSMPCNIPQRPKCKCRTEATSIVVNDEGIWCAKYREGKLLNRWDCLNKQEWDDFYNKYPELRP